MQESPFYELVMQRGIERGIEQSMEQGFEPGFEQGFKQGFEQGFKQGFERGARENAIENTLAILTARFPHADVNALKPALEAIADLNRLKELNLTAALTPSFREFQHGLEP